jgi:O-antigen ligase
MTKKAPFILNQIIAKSFYLLFFLIPLILSPWNFELFEFNKMIAVYALTTIVLGSWLLKTIILKKIIFKRSFWDLPLLLFLLSQTLSTITSLDPHTSLWGYYTRAHGGLASTACYVALYWAFVANMNQTKTQKALKKMLLSALLVATYGILEHFGIDKDYWVQDVQNRVFSTLGQPNWLAAYLVALIPLTMAIANNQILKIGYFLFTIFYLCLIFTKSRSGLFAFAAAFIIFWALAFLQNQKPKALKKKFLVFALIALTLTLVFKNPARDKLFELFGPKTHSELPPGFLISKSTDIRKIVWQGAFDIWQAHPLFGSGVETFAYSYYNFRPAKHNLVSEWDFLYNKAHNEYLNFLATTGAFGLSTYLLLIISFILWSLKKISLRRHPPALPCKAWQTGTLAGFGGILVTNFFGFSVVVIGLLFFLLPALSVGLSTKEKEEKTKFPQKLQAFQIVSISIILVFTFFVLRFAFNLWYADFIFAKTNEHFDNDLYQEAFETAKKTVLLRPKEPTYHDKLAVTSAALAQVAFTQEDATLSAQLAGLAIEESNQALRLNPFHLNFWKNRTRMFLRLSDLDESFKLEALKALIQASELAPTDAKVFYNLALLYDQLDQRQTAIQTLKKTLELKPNYKQARFALALYYYEGKNRPGAIEQLEYIISQIDPADEEIKKLLKDWQP